MIAFMVFAVSAAPAAMNCRKPANQYELTQCSWQDAQKADAALNAQWAKTLRYLKEVDARVGANPKEDTNASALLESQRAWLKYRDAECKLQGFSMHGGTGEPMVVHNCVASLTNARTKELHDLTVDR